MGRDRHRGHRADRRSTVDLEEIQAFARRHLGGYKIPRRVELVEELPRNASGKVLKRNLRADLAGPVDRAVPNGR